MELVGDVTRGSDGVRRCAWAGTAPEYVKYHDVEWGRPVVDDTRLYEKLCLEGFQSGLSWITILRKRENFRRAFAGFEPARVARFGARDVNRLLGDAGIVRHRGKIEAAIANARALVEVDAEHGSLAVLCWSFASRRGRAPRSFADVPAKTDASRALSKELLRLGFRFVGPTTVYAMMQATGIVNDHLVGCTARAECERERRGVSVGGARKV
jgi:DNA-3-methyladenine glycosylase I